MGDLGNTAGKKPNWSQIIDTDNIQDIYGLSAAEGATIAQAIGFSGKDQSGNNRDQLVLAYDGTSAPTVTNWADLPVGTVVFCAKLAAPRIYIHKAQSSPAVIGDWYYIQGTQVT